MTIASATSRISYTGDGGTVAFPVPFYFAANADLVVYLQDSSGNLTLQVLGTHYSLTGATLAAGGTCTFVTAPTTTTGAVVSIYRDPPITQSTSYNNNDPFPAKSHETALDKLTTIGQRTRDLVNRALHITDAESSSTVTTLATVANRKNKLLGFGTSGELTYPLGPTYVAGTFVGVAEVDSRATAQVTTFGVSVNVVRTQGYAAVGDGGGAVYVRGIVSDPGVFQDAGGVYWKLDLTVSPINAAWFGAKGNGVTDDSVAIQAAITAAAGTPVQLNAGTFVVGTALTYSTAAAGIWTPGLHLAGAGPGKTFIDSRVAGTCITSQSTSANKFQLGGWIRDMTIMTTTTATTGIGLKATYQFQVLNVHIIGMTGNGGQINCDLGDADAANIMLWRNCRFENCGGAGLLCNFAAGIVQPSFIRVEDCFFSGNVLAGYYFIGLAGSLINCAFATNTGPGLHIVYNGSSNSSFFCAGTIWENNGSATAPQVRIDSLLQGTFVGCEMASTSVSFPAVVGFALSQAGTNACRSVRFEDTRFRIGAGFNPFTAFKFFATAQLNTIANTTWQSFDAAGQVRYLVDASAYGNRVSDSFSAVQVGQSNGTSTITAVNGANQNLALPVDGTTFGISGPTGAFNFGGFTNGFDGRSLELVNRSGQTLTLNYEDAGSTAANRISAEGAANVTVANAGTVTLRYYGPASRWQVRGKG